LIAKGVRSTRSCRLGFRCRYHRISAV
jgi:hypothetical protein